MDSEGAEEALIIMIKIFVILKYGKDHQRKKIMGLHVLLFDFEKAFDIGEGMESRFII